MSPLSRERKLRERIKSDLKYRRDCGGRGGGGWEWGGTERRSDGGRSPKCREYRAGIPINKSFSRGPYTKYRSRDVLPYPSPPPPPPPPRSLSSSSSSSSSLHRSGATFDALAAAFAIATRRQLLRDSRARGR